MTVSVMAGCGKKEEASVKLDGVKDSSEGSPETVVASFIDTLMSGDTEKALEYTTDDAKEELEDGENPFEELASMATMPDENIESMANGFGLDVDDIKDDINDINEDVFGKIAKMIKAEVTEDVEVDGDEATVVFKIEAPVETSMSNFADEEFLVEIMLDVLGVSIDEAEDKLLNMTEKERKEFLIEFYKTLMDELVKSIEDGDTTEAEFETILVKEDGDWLISEINNK
ncbi:MAG: hypothetical protein Q4B31_00980 [Clostridia bacterium]|nr:hypothetical protein [Clostridia bacterium]